MTKLNNLLKNNNELKDSTKKENPTSKKTSKEITETMRETFDKIKFYNFIRKNLENYGYSNSFRAYLGDEYKEQTLLQKIYTDLNDLYENGIREIEDLERNLRRANNDLEYLKERQNNGNEGGMRRPRRITNTTNDENDIETKITLKEKEIENISDKLKELKETKGKISKDEVKTILQHLNELYDQDRSARLKGEFTQEIPHWKGNYFDADYYRAGIENRTLSVEEYEKMQKQIEKHGSILSRSNKRDWSFGGGDGDVFLSTNTGKLYDVEGAGEKELKEDYKSSCYYSSRSGASASGIFWAGKGTMINMPTSRIDIKYPNLFYKDMNGLLVTMCTDRGCVDENMPTIIKSGKINLGVDVVLLSQKNHLEQGMGKNIIDTIETKGANLKDWPIYTYKIKYFDENLQEQEKLFTYKTDMDPKEIPMYFIGENVFGIHRGFDVEMTDSFIDKVAGIRKYKGKYVRLGQFGLIKEIFDKHPHADMDKVYYEDIEIGNNNEIIHTKEEIKPIYSEKNTTKKINGWVIDDNFAYKFAQDNTGYGIYEAKEICQDHYVEYNESFGKNGSYELIYEDDISLYNKLYQLAGMTNVNMEFEYNVPKEIFEKYSKDYRKRFLKGKLIEKANKSIDIYNIPELTQKQIVKKYLNSHKNEIFTLQDSYNSGNCHPGTKRFIDTFKIGDKITGEQLLKHPHIGKMLGIFDFRKIFIKKILNNKSDMPQNIIQDEYDERKVRRRPRKKI